VLRSSLVSVSVQTVPSPHVDAVPVPVHVALHVPHAVVWPSSHASAPTTIPSPHTALHAVGIAALHVQPASTVHVEEQPSPFIGGVCPSSQASPGSRSPSPHRRIAHTVGLPMSQRHPLSTVQLDEQPSPPIVSPSSQISAPRTRPSPQIPSQADGSPLHCQPPSIVHVAEQPSAPSRSPSSHASVPRTRPSPQIAVQVLGLPAVHVQPPSTAHADEQPSPRPLLPSSQPSPVVRMALPQIGPHALPLQRSPAAQGIPQPPQFAVSLVVLLQPPEAGQQVSPAAAVQTSPPATPPASGPHTQRPQLHVSPAPQTRPHAPQFVGSVWRFSQPVVQKESPPRHTGPLAPATSGPHVQWVPSHPSPAPHVPPG
jgi:hypothetical protein